MRLGKLSAGQRIVLLPVAALLVLAGFALPASAAHRNQFIRTVELFEPPPSDCSNGSFEANGAFEATGDARTCSRNFRAPGIVTGTTQLRNTDRLRMSWKVQCSDTARPAFTCDGQWSVDGPNWRGGGNVRFLLDFTDHPFGSLRGTFQGNLTAV